MLSLSPEGLIGWLNSLPPEILWVMQLLFAFGAILAFLRFFGLTGLYIYIAVAVIGANLQVLKVVPFSVFPEPVALGTILFASTYLATDIINERFGVAAARRAVWLGFAAYLTWTLLTILTLGFRPLEGAGEDLAWAEAMQGHMLALFLPAPALFAAGMIAYLTSQLFDVWFFDRIRRQTEGRRLWLRNNLSTAISALIDNTIFSVLAWVVFADEPMAWGTLVMTYILGTYGLRLIVALFDTPFMYLARKVEVQPDPPERGAVAQPSS